MISVPKQLEHDGVVFLTAAKGLDLLEEVGEHGEEWHARVMTPCVPERVQKFEAAFAHCNW